MLDIAVSYNRYQFLGNEFLTWLWYQIENRPTELIPADEGQFQVGNRVVLENRSAGSLEQIIITGDEAGLEEGLVALKKGALVTELNLQYRTGEKIWQFTLKGESLGFSGLKVSESFSDKQSEEAVLEKFQLCEMAVETIHSIFKTFISLRISESWQAEVVPNIINWIH